MPRAPHISDAGHAAGADASAQLPLFHAVPASPRTRLSQRIKALFARPETPSPPPSQPGSHWADSFFDPGP